MRSSPESTEAVICTFECTFCKSCAETQLKGICPNCGGNLRHPRVAFACQYFLAELKSITPNTIG